MPHSKTGAGTSAGRMSSYRQRMRAGGLRPVQLWVPDTRSAEFLERCKTVSLAVAAFEAEHDDLDDWFALEDAWEGIEPYEP